MTVAFDRGARSSPIMLPRQAMATSIVQEQAGKSVAFLIVVGFLLGSTFLVPESPEQLASICERHNPEIVCRVW